MPLLTGDLAPRFTDPVLRASDPPLVHILGIGGTAMAALPSWLRQTRDLR